MKNIIIDTDLCNEIDDPFALAYALCAKNLNILAITLCPHQSSYKSQTIEDGMMDSYFEAKRLCRLAGKGKTPIYKGCLNFFSNAEPDSSMAVEKIVEIAMKKQKTTIVCLGTLTNIASAIKLQPKIVNRIEVLWLGTKNLLQEYFTDNNYKKDKKAFEIVAKSNVKFTVMPSYVGKYNATSIYEVKDHIAINPLGKHLFDLFDNYHSKIEERGLKYIYDISLVAYLIDNSIFTFTEINRNLLLKEQKKMKNPAPVTYVYDGSSNNSVWRHFIKTIENAPDNIFAPKTFFISDTHFNQQDKIRNRKLKVDFKTKDQQDHECIKRWNSLVGKNDTVYHLGDFGDYSFIKKLHGKVTLICGNYEKRDANGNFEKFKQKLIKLGFKDVIENNLILDKKLFGEKINLVHKPTDINPNLINLFGHVHTLKPISKNGFNVCCEYHNLTPVGEDIIHDYLHFFHTCADQDVFAD